MPHLQLSKNGNAFSKNSPSAGSMNKIAILNVIPLSEYNQDGKTICPIRRK